MPRGGARAKSGRKAMEDTQRVTIILDAGTRGLLDAHGGKSKGSYIREAMTALLGELAAGVDVQPVAITGETGNFPLKAPRKLLEAAELHNGTGRRFFGLSDFVRTAVALRAGKGVAA